MGRRRVLDGVTSYKDIQRATGLSLSTISKYFNGGNVRDVNRALIQEAVRALDFRPNGFARSLRLRRSHTIGVLLPALQNEFHLTIIAGVEEALRAEGMSLIVASSPGEGSSAVDLLLSRMVDGIIAVPSPHDAARLEGAAERIPIVIVDWEAPVSRADGVFLDNVEAGAMGVRHLLDHGHSRVGLVGGDRTISSVRLRGDGAMAQLAMTETDLDRRLVTTGPLTVEEGQAAMNGMLAVHPRPTGVFALNYELTLGALIAINQSGLRLGRDISLVGFDSPELARATNPRLTVVTQPTRDIAAQAAEFTLRRLRAGDSGPPEMRLMPPRLLVGQSVVRLEHDQSSA